MDKMTLVSDKDGHFGICLKFIRFHLNIRKIWKMKEISEIQWKLIEIRLIPLQPYPKLDRRDFSFRLLLISYRV